MKVSIKEIAQKTGFSPATVSLSLNGSNLVKDETKALIKKVADEMGYVPNPYARKLVLQKSGMLGLVVPTIRNVYYADLVHYINNAVRSAGYGLIISTSDNSAESETRILREMSENRVEGVMLAPVNVPNDNTDYIESYDIPIVFSTARYKGVNKPCVMCDLENGMYSLASRIVKSGKESILLVTGHGGVDSLDSRESGFHAATKNIKTSTVRVGKLGYNGGISAAEDILNMGGVYEAIVCVDDMVASGVINHLVSRGYRVPESVWVTGFDDNVFSKAAPVPITTVRQDVEKLAYNTVESMLKLINGEDASDIVIPCETVVRKSAL